jgi:lipopolysaccharide export LptBFGC system permease protein LptF
METVYLLSKGINAVVMTLAAFPFFFWVRRLSTSAWALVATGLLLVLPAFTYRAC